MEWCIEGYQLWMINGASKDTHDDTVLQMSFLKSALAVNPTMVSIFSIKYHLNHFQNYLFD